MPKRSCFLVMERGYEYNDENYEMNEGGNPTKGFGDKAKAEEAAHNKNREALRTVDVGQFAGEDGYGLMRGGLSRRAETFLDSIAAITGKPAPENYWELSFPECTDEQADQLLELMNAFRPYYVVAVAME